MEVIKKIPEFASIQHLQEEKNVTLVVNTKHNIYWQVFEFKTVSENVFLQNQNAFFHKKYKFALLIVKSNDSLQEEKVLKVTARAVDWYANIYLKKPNNGRQ